MVAQANQRVVCMYDVIVNEEMGCKMCDDVGRYAAVHLRVSVTLQLLKIMLWPVVQVQVYVRPPTCTWRSGQPVSNS